MEIAGRTTLITGAARGIGAATAQALARRGGNVALVGREPELLAAVAAEIGERAAWFEADVTDGAALDAAVRGTVERFGGIDVVLANAGIASFGTVATTDPEAFARTIDVNVTGVFRTVRATLPHVVERRGYVLVVASVAAFTPVAGMSAYAASKAGAESIASALATEVARDGVAVGSAHPSWIDTDMVRGAMADLGSLRRLRRLLPWPMRATTTVEDCAEAFVHAIEQRARRVYVPRAGALAYWGRALIQSRMATRVTGRLAAPIVPELEREVAALGRSVGAHAEVSFLAGKR
jgi:NAD(P)-dependent dehydrogenase (short-subunit alcohol dehydrogenase family)